MVYSWSKDYFGTCVESPGVIVVLMPSKPREYTYLKFSVTFNYFLHLLLHLATPPPGYFQYFRLAWALWWDSHSGYGVIG